MQNDSTFPPPPPKYAFSVYFHNFTHLKHEMWYRSVVNVMSCADICVTSDVHRKQKRFILRMSQFKVRQVPLITSLFCLFPFVVSFFVSYLFVPS
jgi:hypothetical protein